MNGRPCRVLHVITGLEVGGAETMLAKLLATLDDARFPAAVAALTADGPLAGRLAELGVTVHDLGLRRGRADPRALVRLRRIVADARPHLVQGWMYHGNLAATLGAWGRPAHVIWNIRHSLYDLRDEARLTRWVIRAGGRLAHRPAAIVHNAAISVAQHARHGYPEHKAVVIPNGFDLARFRPDPAAGGALRAELGLPADAVLVGLVARRHRFKGHDRFLEAVARVRATRPHVHAVCAGRGTEDAPDLAARAARADLAGHVHLLGPRADGPRLLAGLDVLCCASRWGEGFPNVLGEALACGTACVTTDVGEAGAIVHGLGPVVPPDDVPALAAGLAEVLDRDAATRTRLAAAGRERVAAEWSLAAVAARYAELYSTIGAGADA